MNKNVWMVALILMISSFSMEMTAQENLLAMVQKCETIDSKSVEMNVIRKKKNNSKEEMISIRITNNPSLINEFILAAQKDEPNAIQSIDEKVGTKIVPKAYQFKDVNFMFSWSKEGNLQISMRRIIK